MQDRFKFRAFCYGNFIYRDFSKEYSVYNDDGFPVGNVPNDIEWEQCTGLKDKNDRLIYEGDFLKDHKGIWQVLWHEKEAAFYIYNKKRDFYLSPFIGEFEIISNIHENPELMEE